MSPRFLRNFSTWNNCVSPLSKRRGAAGLPVSLLAIVITATSAIAQTAEFTQNSPSANTMTLQVPLRAYPGRGASLPVSLYYSSKVWRLGFIKSIYSSYALPRSAAEAIYAEHSTAGWTTSLDVPKVEWPKQNDVYWFNGKAYPRGPVANYTYRVARVFIHMPDGSTHELRKSDQAYPATNGIDMVGTFWAVDGSRMRYDSYSESTGTLSLADGTRYVLNGGTTQYIDRNGNTLNYNGSTRQWTDTLGRVIGRPLPAVPIVEDQPYVVPGLGGNITYIFKWRALSTVLTQTQSLKPAGDYYLPNPALPPTDYNGNNFPQTIGPSTPSLFQSEYSDDMVESSYTYIVGRGQVGNTPFNPVVLAEIVLPNGLSYKFGYNINGEIDKVTYPAGAYQRYQHAQVSPLTYAAAPYQQGSRGVTSRWVSPNGTGGSDESQWIYSNEGSKVTATDPNGTRTETYLHTTSVAPNTSFGHDDPRIGQPYEERVYAPVSQGGAMLRRSLTEYAWTSASFARPSPGSGTYTANRNTRPIKTVALILDTGGNALTSASTSQYDTAYQFTVGPDRTQSAEYAYTTVDQSTAQSGGISAIPLGALVRSSETTFLTSDDNYRNRNILGLVSWSAVKNAAGTIVSQASFNYDESSYPLLTYGSVNGWTDPQTTYRGNVTTASRWLDYPTGNWISTHAQYDQCGSVRSSSDAKGNSSQTEYSSVYAYAYPTQTTSAVPDASGMYGQTTSLVTTAAYDLNTGLVTSATDANGKTTTFEYNDPLNRIRKINYPDGGWMKTNYTDTVGDTYVHSQTLQQTSPTQQTLDSYQFFDKAGRSVRSFAKEGATFLTSDTQYDNLGRVWRVSNPYRTTAISLSDGVNPSNTWTTNVYDSLNRVKSVTTPDGAQVATDYSAVTTGSYFGTSVTVTDPALRKRKSISDAQGRVIQVIEDPTNLAYQTNYTYDVLNNLRKVEQGSQLRYFGYDSLSRVIRVRNIEQTVNTALNWYDPVTAYNGGWTRAMSYDNNGNVVTRVDARNVTSTYGYDALNRNTTVRYTDGTKDIDRHYDGAINGKGRFYYSNWDPSNNARFDSLVAIDEYDVMGRPKNYRQHFLTNGVASPQFNVKYTYNLAGQALTQTYPSGHTVTFAYDGAGRINNYSGNLGDGVSRSYSTGITYSQFGGLEQEQFGTQTQLYQKLHYNVRGQLYDTRLSSYSLQANEWDWNRGALVNYFSSNYSWGGNSSGSGPDNNGNVTLQQHWVPANDSYTDYTYTQDAYSYDTLNRLASTNEVHGGPWGASGQDYIQTYVYDRYGNRTINQGQTSANVPRPNYTVDTNTNRLIAPMGYSYAYDAAGNQTNDTYTGAGSREYDGENHLKQAWANGQWQTYTYDADGRRIKRNVNGIETWNVYGMGGELLAEYKSGAAPFLPAKEYGYRGGQLLVTMSSGDDVRLARFVTNLYYGALQRDPTTQELQDKVNQLAAAGAQSQSQLLAVASQIARSLFTVTNYETSPYRSDAQYVADLYLAYLQRGPDDGGLGWWVGQLGGGRANVCNAFEGSSEFATLVATLYGTATSDNERTEHYVNNFYLGAYGRNATSTELQQQRDALNAAAAQGPSQVQAQAESFGRSLFAAQVNDAGISNTQFVTNLYEAFLQRGPDAGGLGWWSGQATVGQGRQNVLGSFATCGPFYELAGTLYREAFWLVSDRLGTPRMIVDKSGSLASVKRHDYLPFGEEIGGPLVGLLGGRTTAQGYTGDSVRQHFTGYEADAETGLNFAQARYQSSIQGRFTSVDRLGASAGVTNPQSFNRYSYVENNPINYNDPTGMMLSDIGVYQTSNPEVANILENRMVQLVRQMSSPQTPQSPQTPRTPYVGDGIVDAAAGETPADEVALESVTVLGRNVNINYADELSGVERVMASDRIARAAGLVNEKAAALEDDEKKAIWKIRSVSVVGPGTSLGATGSGMSVDMVHITYGSIAYLASLFGHEGQHNLNTGKYTGSRQWLNEQSASMVQRGIGIKLGITNAERIGLDQWIGIGDSSREVLQRHMERGKKSR